MTQTHTPGPWVACPGNAGQVYKIETNARGNQNDGYEIAALRGPDKDANARLIAAAPTMYDLLSAAYNALGDCEKALGGDMPRLAELRGEIRAAIARATGKGE